MENLKKPSVLLNLLLILIIFFLLPKACKGVDDDDMETVSPEEIERDSILKAAREKLFEENIIPLDTAVKIRNKYITDRIKPFKAELEKMYRDPSFEDTRNVWFDINVMEAYIRHVREKAKDVEGLQFYFSVGDAADSARNHQTFFIAPTKKNGGIQSGFTIIGKKTVFLNERFKDFELNIKQGKVEEAGFFSTTIALQEEEKLLANRGSGAPPHNNN